MFKYSHPSEPSALPLPFPLPLSLPRMNRFDMQTGGDDEGYEADLSSVGQKSCGKLALALTLIHLTVGRVQPDPAQWFCETGQTCSGQLDLDASDAGNRTLSSSSLACLSKGGNDQSPPTPLEQT